MQTQNSHKLEHEAVPIVDAPYRTKKILVAIAVVLGIAALLVYFWDPAFISWMTGNTKR